VTGEQGLGPRERQTLGALRYAVNEEAATYLAIMGLFTTGMSGFLSDQSAAEVAERLATDGFELDPETVDLRLSYLVEHGNLMRSPRETEARSLREYLTTRARYQLSQRGELVHRQVVELLGHTESAREVSSEMLGGILASLETLAALVDALDDADPREVSMTIGTVFAQFELLVSSTRQFYTYLSQVLSRFDLGRDEFVLFKAALLNYLQRFVDEVSQHMPQLGDLLVRLEPDVPAICARANAGERLVGLDGEEARRATGLDPGDWVSLRVWFVGGPGRRSDADNVRRLATDAMRSLLVNLRRIASSADREQSRYGDLLGLARWFEDSDDAGAHELWAAAFGLYSARHLAFSADDDAAPVPATASWWETPVASVPVALRRAGERRAGGRSGVREDFSQAKQARLRERRRAEEKRAAALREIGALAGTLTDVHLSDDARGVLLDLYAKALTGHARPLGDHAAEVATPVDGLTLRLTVRHVEGAGTTVTGPQGRLVLADMSVEVTLERADVPRWREAGA
jgi:uncharacterized protein (TIGR02677 family)